MLSLGLAVLAPVHVTAAEVTVRQGAWGWERAKRPAKDITHRAEILFRVTSLRPAAGAPGQVWLRGRVPPECQLTCCVCLSLCEATERGFLDFHESSAYRPVRTHTLARWPCRVHLGRAEPSNPRVTNREPLVCLRALCFLALSHGSPR